MSKHTRIVLGDWATCKQDAMVVRQEVFVKEQHVPPEIELDERDEYCMHAVAYDADGTPIGTGRLLPDGHIGRIAVRAPYRGDGVGSKLLAALVNEARRKHHLEVVLSAQRQAQSFYARHGFVAEGKVYMDAGIEHVTMRHALTA